jgi:hypothetical protein
MVENSSTGVDEQSSASNAKSLEDGLTEWFAEKRDAFHDLSMKDEITK